MIRNKTKICHIQLLPILSGVQRSMVGLLKMLDTEKYSIYVICKHPGELTKAVSDLGINYFCIPSLTRRISPLKDINTFFRLFLFFKRNRFDIVHTHSSKTGILGRMAARMAGVKLVVHSVHGLPFHEFSNKFKVILYSFFEKTGAFFADKIIFVNNEERQLAIKKSIVPPQKAITVYNGFNSDILKTLDVNKLRTTIRKKYDIQNKHFVIGYFGRLWKQKNPETLLDIIHLCTDLPVYFMIIGDGPFKFAFDKQAAMDNRVKVLGWVKDPLTFYPAIDLLILPSLWEGLPMTLIEAMAFGKPLIASNIKGNRECVEHGVNGYLCEPRHALDFKNHIKKIMDDKALYHSMGVNSRKFSNLYFNSIKNNRKILNIYKNI